MEIPPFQDVIKIPRHFHDFQVHIFYIQLGKGALKDFSQLLFPLVSSLLTEVTFQQRRSIRLRKFNMDSTILQ